MALNQMIVEDLKKNKRASKLPDVDAREIKVKATELIMQQVSENDLEILKQHGSKIDVLIDNKIEQQVVKVKNTLKTPEA
ncbi:hypothetical protein SAMN00017405_1182 [Desulfonispora thiosulfatigenes DSM 11270]|uniref:Uncharacterized protein n=1 Tax=Desulfonispora thiosulfatigenes DSM 11270 TaxID=656914 RepID=A0A1W1V046_DESTI|nr:hypothetical protein [Desulfonispora thiosulfatigenes]SMB86732.1 hypothetical protein SAMN00017405_1182 [Desulfonispora thiosulfatigenes DSM 11270]